MNSKRLTPWNILWLLAAAAYFIVPLYGTVEFSLETGPKQYGFDSYRSIFNDPGFKDSFFLSFQLAVWTIIISLVLMVPTVYWVHLRLPRVRRIMEFIAILPFVVPPVALAVGLLRELNGFIWFVEKPQVLVPAYVVLVLPFTFRSLDAGMRSIDLHTLTEAAQSMGAGWLTILMRVILPNLRSAILASAFLTVTLVLGEFTMASLMLFNTFAVYVNYIGQTKANPAAALAIISFALTWIFMLGILVVSRGFGGRRQQAQLGGTR